MGAAPGKPQGSVFKFLTMVAVRLIFYPLNHQFGSGNSYGWYGFKDLLSLTGAGSGTDIYTGDFTAELSAITGQTVTAGSVNAQLQVVVSFQ